MEIRTIKGIDRERWLKFREIAARKGLKLGELFSDMIEEYNKKSDEFWDKILSGEKRISDKEAEEMHKTVRKLRKEKWFKNELNF